MDAELMGLIRSFTSNVVNISTSPVHKGYFLKGNNLRNIFFSMVECAIFSASYPS